MISYNIFKNNEDSLGSFVDERGAINDIFSNLSIQHACYILSKKGAVRGNHYHKYTTQYTLIMQGNLFYKSKNLENSEIKEGIFDRGSMIISPPMEAHAMKALHEDCEFFAFASGPRGGKNYEKDTYRLSTENFLI